MQRFLPRLLPVAGAILLAACGSQQGSGSAFALVGAPTKASYTASANFLIDGNTCNYYTYRGDGTNPPEAAKGCTLMEDKANSVGTPHTLVKIGFATDKGEQVLTLTQSGNNALAAASVPDIGMYLPNNYTVAAPVANLALSNSTAGSRYSNFAVHVDGVRCTLSITSAADNASSSMPCGLVYWSDASISVAIPGALISNDYASVAWTLHFVRNTGKAAAWNLAQPPPGFPASFTEVTSTSR